MEIYSEDRLGRLSALRPVRRRVPVDDARQQEEPDALASVLGARIDRNYHGEHLVTQEWYATPETCEVDPEALRLVLPVKSTVTAADVAVAQDSRNWLFLDTETTGLSGGSGTYAFLIGLAWWDGGGLHVEQLFMRDHSEEHSVLLKVAERLKERPVLVTFNGKSFDWPLLETRFRMTRTIDVPKFAAHLDFLHPARQLWRRQLDSVRLADLERHILRAESLGWSRQQDIDSKTIPTIYFDYLRRGPCTPLVNIFQHNRMDLRGLAALAGHVLRIFSRLDTMGAADQSGLELYSLSRFLNQRGDRPGARRICEQSLSAGLPEAFVRTAKHDLARLAKRERDIARSMELWQELADGPDPSLEAFEQLALHYERAEGNPSEALRVTGLALSQLRRTARLGLIKQGSHERLYGRLTKRLARLERKANGARRPTQKRLPSAAPRLKI